jgi:hypothetical protein
MKDIDAQRSVVRTALESIDECAYWFTQNRQYITDEIGIMFETSLSRLQALESAITIKIRQMTEEKLAAAMISKIKSKERIDAVRKQVESNTVKRTGRTKAAAKPSARTAANRSGRSSTPKVKR